MPDQLQLRGGTTAQHTSFTGASKEVTVDTTKKTAVVHDGSTVGGVPLLREDGSNSALTLGSAGTPSIKFTGDTNTGIFSPGADQLAISTNGTGRLFVDASGLVGIGATPTSKLEVSHSGANVVNLTGPANASLSMTGASVGLVLRCGGEATFGATTNDPLALITNNTERLRITSAGLVGIGTSSPGWKLDVNGEVAFSPNTAGKDTFIFTTNASNDAFLRLKSNTTDKVNIQANGTSYFNGGNVGIGSTGPGATLDIKAAASTHPLIVQGPSSEFARIDSSGRLLVGTSTQVGNVNGGILQLGSGITFPATAVAASDANTLDDYEEGTWTPVLSGGTTTTYQYQDGYYVRIGRLVHVTARFAITSIGNGSDRIITGLPFSIGSPSPGNWGVDFWADINSSVYSLGIVVAGNTTSFNVVGQTSATTSQQNISIFKNGARVDFGGTYQVY